MFSFEIKHISLVTPGEIKSGPVGTIWCGAHGARAGLLTKRPQDLCRAALTGGNH